MESDTCECQYLVDEAIKLDCDDIVVIVSIAGLYSRLNDYRTADKYFKMASGIDENDVFYLMEMAKHLLNQNRFTESIEYFDRILEMNGELAEALMYKSMALSEIGRDFESEDCFNRAIELDPDSINLFDEVLTIEE